MLAASAAMAESVPPSIALILLGSATSISTGALFIAGMLPAATSALCLMIIVRLRARHRRTGSRRRARAARKIARTGTRAIMPLMMPVILIGGIIGGIGTPTEVSTFAVLYGLALGLGYRRIDVGNLWTMLEQRDAAQRHDLLHRERRDHLLVGADARRRDDGHRGAPSRASGPSLFLPAVILITILMGAVLESFVTIVILAPLLLPVALQLGIDPLQYGIIMTEAFGIGSILPPIGIALYVACAICGARVEHASKPLLCYLAVLIAGLLLVAFVPWITTMLPDLLELQVLGGHDDEQHVESESNRPSTRRHLLQAASPRLSLAPLVAATRRRRAKKHPLRASRADRARLAHLGRAVQEGRSSRRAAASSPCRSFPTRRWATSATPRRRCASARSRWARSASA